jgi:ABC-type transporter Mla MlaB component
MLRVTRVGAGEETDFLRVEGRLTAADLARFHQTCAELLARGRGLRLELSGLQFADREAVVLLRALRGRGVELVGASGFVDALLADSPL